VTALTAHERDTNSNAIAALGRRAHRSTGDRPCLHPRRSGEVRGSDHRRHVVGCGQHPDRQPRLQHCSWRTLGLGDVPLAGAAVRRSGRAAGLGHRHGLHHRGARQSRP
jgi:hypothetical protein